jgi:XRE family transcriptional regulator, regulator of sulfur utilization
VLAENCVRDQLLFGKRIRAIRKAGRLSRETLAERTEITSNYLGEIERGEKWPSLQILTALARALEVSPARFFEFDLPVTDPKALRKELDLLLSKRDIEQLQQILRVLVAFFNS